MAMIECLNKKIKEMAANSDGGNVNELLQKVREQMMKEFIKYKKDTEESVNKVSTLLLLLQEGYWSWRVGLYIVNKVSALLLINTRILKSLVIGYKRCYYYYIDTEESVNKVSILLLLLQEGYWKVDKGS